MEDLQTEPIFEQHRFVQLTEGHPLSGKEITRRRIKQIIKNAPTLKGGEQNKALKDRLPSSIVIKYPEDASLIPTIEDSTYEILLDLQKDTDRSEKVVSLFTIMNFDRRISSLEIESDGTTITGETFLSHEEAHAKAAHEMGQSDVYILVPFAWHEDKSGKKVLRAHRPCAMIEDTDSSKAIINIGLAPKYPSRHDIILTQQLVRKSVGHLLPSSHRNILRKRLEGLPKLNGKTITAEHMQALLLDEWQQIYEKEPS